MSRVSTRESRRDSGETTVEYVPSFGEEEEVQQPPAPPSSPAGAGAETPAQRMRRLNPELFGPIRREPPRPGMNPLFNDMNNLATYGGQGMVLLEIRRTGTNEVLETRRLPYNQAVELANTPRNDGTYVYIQPNTYGLMGLLG